MVKDVLIDCEPILGYLHKEIDIIAENRTIIQLQYLHYVTRWVVDSLAGGGANPSATTPITPSSATRQPDACAPTTDVETPSRLPTGPPPSDSTSAYLTVTVLLVLLSTSVAYNLQGKKNILFGYILLWH
ncbi:hypothetical protein MIMGU_mgv11b023208mg [Erythranthe guttata]|uniref:Uncharacterized protein n=1 Tax=Erythranthe guttata TaxID=4155 RepID=A0A022RJ98_ERYGU|nr:hypothetical protein MIMGU_mgv11b023208mg [Erythranthe guttata]